jgi:hypothetical protein
VNGPSNISIYPSTSDSDMIEVHNVTSNTFITVNYTISNETYPKQNDIENQTSNNHTYFSTPASNNYEITLEVSNYSISSVTAADVGNRTSNTLIISTTPVLDHVEMTNDSIISTFLHTNISQSTPQTTPSTVNSINETPVLFAGEQISTMQIDPTILQNVAITSNGIEQGVSIPAFSYMLLTKISVQKVLDTKVLETTTTDSSKVKVSDVLKFQPSGTVFRSPVTVFLAASRPVVDGKRFAVFKLDEATQTWWEQQNSVTDKTTGIVSVQTMSFSFWTVFEVPNRIETTPVAVEYTTGEKKKISKVQIAIISTVSAFFGSICYIFLLKRYVISPAMRNTQNVTPNPSISTELSFVQSQPIH